MLEQKRLRWLTPTSFILQSRKGSREGKDPVLAPRYLSHSWDQDLEPAG